MRSGGGRQPDRRHVYRARCRVRAGASAGRVAVDRGPCRGDLRAGHPLVHPRPDRRARHDDDRALVLLGACGGAGGTAGGRRESFWALALVKVTAVFAVLAVAGWLALELWRRARAREDARPDLGPAVRLLGVFAVVGFCGLWLLDLRFTTFTSPLEHLSRTGLRPLRLSPPHPRRAPTRTSSSQPWDGWSRGPVRLPQGIGGLGGGLATPSSTFSVVIDFHVMLNPVLIGSLVPVVLFAGAGRDSMLSAGGLGTRLDGRQLSPVDRARGRLRSGCTFITPSRSSRGLPLATVLLTRAAPSLPPRRLGYLAAMAVVFVASCLFPFRQVPEASRGHHGDTVLRPVRWPNGLTLAGRPIPFNPPPSSSGPVAGPTRRWTWNV